MAETAQSPPQSAGAVSKLPDSVIFSIWPPSERTRNAVRTRLIETLSAPSILSKRYGTISHEEAIGVARLLEEEAFETADKLEDADDKGMDTLQVYSKEISKRMLDTMKARSGDSGTVAATPQVNDAASKAAEEVDASPAAPPLSEHSESAGDE